MDYRTHICSDNTRWDTLAWTYYSNPFDYARIIQANPEYRHLPILDAGVVLRIPVVAQAVAPISKEQLPPWRR